MHTTSSPADAGTPGDDDSLTVGERIRRCRDLLGWTQARLARRMKSWDEKYRDTTEQSTWATYVSRWERNVVEPDEYNRRILAMALNVEVTDFGLTVNPYFRLERKKKRRPLRNRLS